MSPATIWRRLRDAGVISDQPKKRPKSSYIRFQADQPNETWQSDMTHWRLADGTDVEILTFLDDHSRYALSVTAHGRVNTPIVVAEFTQTAETHGIPASVLTDNGLIFTTRFAGRGGGRNRFETLLADLGVTHKHSAPNHPTTCGKVERFQQTLKRHLASLEPPDTIAELQGQLDAFVELYNTKRPHRSLDRVTPAVAYQRLPKAHPGPLQHEHRQRVRRDRVDTSGVVTLRYNGRLHHIGIGRAHARTPILLLIDDRDIRIINATTGELLRHLTLDPTRDYQPIATPTTKKPGP